ncbi:MAG: hypothetical protein ACI9N9_001338 [Enterobacterales bacterium]|jgi:hypothetical protein
MSRFKLIKRQEVPIPTMAGWLVLVILLTLVIIIFGRGIHSFLSPVQPLVRSQVLVVEGWLDSDQLDQAIIAYRKGNYEYLITSGGPINNWSDVSAFNSYADRAAYYLKTHGLDDILILSVPAPASAQNNTFLSAVMVREALSTEQKITVFDVYSGGVHSRRTHMVYRLAFGSDVDIGILSASPTNYDETQWWKESDGAKSVIGETINLLWTVCCFYPPPPGSHEEKWAVSRTAEAD